MSFILLKKGSNRNLIMGSVLTKREPVIQSHFKIVREFTQRDPLFMKRLKMNIIEANPGPQLTEETLRQLATIGCRILGYNCSELG